MAQTDKTVIQTELPRAATGVSSLRQKIARAALPLAFAFYACLLAMHIGAYSAGSDQSGYLNSAMLLGRGTSRMPQRVLPGTDFEKTSPRIYVPLGMRDATGNSSGRLMVPVYSTGLPLLIAGMAGIAGWNAAPHATILILSLLGILVTAWLAHEWGLPGIWPWIAALLLACSPLYVTYSLQLMSDMPALVFTTLAVVLAWKSRGHRPWALGAGAALAFAVLVRPNNALVLLPAAICLGADWRRWALLGAGGLPGTVFLLLYNRFNYGAPLDTGYGDLSGLFGAKYVFPTLLFYAVWLPVLISPAGTLFAGLPFLVRRATRKALVLITWISSILGFYAFYKVTSRIWWELRFLLPAFPPMLVGSLWVLRSWLQTDAAARLQKRLVAFLQRPFPRVPAVVVWTAAGAFCIGMFYDKRHVHSLYIHYALPLVPLLLAGGFCHMRRYYKTPPPVQSRVIGMTLLLCTICLWDFQWNHEEMTLGIGNDGLMYRDACAWANEHLPPTSVIYARLASGAILSYTPFTVLNFNCADHDLQNKIQSACAVSGRPVYALLHDNEIEAEIKRHGLSGNWVPEKRVVLFSFWRLESPGSTPATP